MPCDPPLLYNGDSTQHHPRVYLIFWGPEWSSDTSGTIGAAQGFISALANSNYNAILSQYFDKLDGPGNHYISDDTVLAGSWIDSAVPPSSVGPSETFDEVTRANLLQLWSDTADTQYIVFTQQGTNVVDYGTKNCAWHSDGIEGAQYVFSLIPYQDSQNCQGSLPTAARVTFYESHEYAETVTDPIPLGGWATPSGQEIADLCLDDPPGDLAGLDVTLLWDNSANGCDASHALRPMNTTTAGVARLETDNKFHWLRTNNNATPFTPYFPFGNADSTVADMPISGDWNGDGITTAGIVRRLSTGQYQWLLTNNDQTPVQPYLTYGNANSTIPDVPIVGDWNGDGTYTPGVARAMNGRWLFLLENSNGTISNRITYGQTATDTPIAGDWNGDGITDIGVVRKSGTHLVWYMANLSATTINQFSFGVAGRDQPITGDWDGDGRWTPGVTHDSNGRIAWDLSDESGVLTSSFLFGQTATDTPVAGDWNGGP